MAKTRPNIKPHRWFSQSTSVSTRDGQGGEQSQKQGRYPARGIVSWSSRSCNVHYSIRWVGGDDIKAIPQSSHISCIGSVGQRTLLEELTDLYVVGTVERDTDYFLVQLYICVHIYILDSRELLETHLAPQYGTIEQLIQTRKHLWYACTYYGTYLNQPRETHQITTGKIPS